MSFNQNFPSRSLLKTGVFIAASLLTGYASADPGPVSLTVGGLNYRVTTVAITTSEQLQSLSLFEQLRVTPWYTGVATTVPGADATATQAAAAYYTASGAYVPNSLFGSPSGPLIVFNATRSSPINTGSDGFGLVQYDAAGTPATFQLSFFGLELFFSSPRYFLVLSAPVFPSPADTLESFRPNAAALRNVFNLQSAKIAQGLSYDCTVYDQKNMCVSFLGSMSDGKDFDVTTGALIVAHKPTSRLRFGGYIDQSLSDSSSFGGLTVKKGAPGYGVFGVWTQNADGSGVQVRAAANFGKVDMETTRTAVDTAEAGFGKSNIKSSGFELQVSRAYAINPSWSARPYVGYRKTTNTRAGYTEQSSEAVTAPLTYSKLKQNTEALTAGVTFGHMLSAQTSLTLTAGVDHDLKNRADRYQATNADIGDIDSIDMGATKKTRPTASIALNHNIDKTQRIGVSVMHRKEVFSSTSTTSAFVQYTKGF
jgi:hypothetical protein